LPMTKMPEINEMQNCLKANKNSLMKAKANKIHPKLINQSITACYIM
jgi:hypothetical protein